jgi:hypothetical protein
MKKSDRDANDFQGERRNFLGKLKTMAAAMLAGVLGLPTAANALVPVYCCTLCHDPATCSFSECSCYWGWCCQDGKWIWGCSECMMSGTPGYMCEGNSCGNSGFLANWCSFAKCSYAFPMGFYP